MTAYPPAARTLIAQVRERYSDAEINPTGDADGYGVTRSITFDAETSEWLTPILEACDDERIDALDHDEGKVTVTFVPDIRADYADEFEIDEADEVLSEDDDEDEEDDDGQ